LSTIETDPPALQNVFADGVGVLVAVFVAVGVNVDVVIAEPFRTATIATIVK